MNRKNNPMLSLVALVLLALILAFTCTGCRLITDTETGVQYLAYSEYHTGIGLCKLEG